VLSLLPLGAVVIDQVTSSYAYLRAVSESNSAKGRVQVLTVSTTADGLFVKSQQINRFQVRIAALRTPRSIPLKMLFEV
jgi:hypothetical protein